MNGGQTLISLARVHVEHKSEKQERRNGSDRLDVYRLTHMVRIFGKCVAWSRFLLFYLTLLLGVDIFIK